MKRGRIWLAGAAVVWTSLALAQDNPGTDARQLGANGNSQAASGATAAPSSYPGYTTSNPPQTTYYNSGAAIQSQAQAAAAAAPAGDASQVVTTNALSGPQFYFNSNDPVIQNGTQATSAGGSLLANNYQGCQGMTVGRPGGLFTTATCYADQLEVTPTCTRNLSTSCPSNAPSQAGIQAGAISSDMTWSYTFPTLSLGNFANSDSNNYWTGNCTIYDRTTTFTVDNSALIQQFSLDTAGFDDYMYVAINDHVVFVGPYGGNMLAINNGQVQYSTTGTTGPCELSTAWVQHPNVDLKPYLVTGTNTIHTIVEVAGTGHGYMYITATDYPDCSANDQWSAESCPSGVNLNSTTTNGQASGACVLQSSVCTDGPGIHTVDGIPQYRACWAYQDTYLCKNPQQQEEAACGQLRSQGCQQTASTCVATDSSGTCTRYQQSFQCPSSSPGTQQVDICGGDLYCPNGNCTSDVEAAAVSSSNVTQMAQASSWLQAAQEAAKDNTNSTGTFSFFLGQGEQCTESAVGFSDCCSASGWGSSVGLASCSTEEKQLGVARQAGQTHEVGTYSSGSFVLKTTYDVFCVFSSMLSRIIQEQGRQQLGIGWGTPKSPNCQALTAAQFSSLNFNKMDFSEFYAYAESQANTGLSNRESDASIQQRTQQDIQYLSQNPGATSGQAATTQP